MEKIKDIWLKHIDVQEQILKLRTSPIPIIPNSAIRINGKLMLTVDDSNNKNLIVSKLSQILQTTEAEILTNNGFFYVDSETNINRDELTEIANFAKKNYIDISTLPIIDGQIKKPVSNILQICEKIKKQNIETKPGEKDIIVKISDLTKLSEIISTDSNLLLPNKAISVFRVAYSPICYLRKIYPGIEWNFINKLRLSNEGIFSSQNLIQTKGGYLKPSLLNKLHEDFELNLYAYTFKFFIPDTQVARCKQFKEKYGLPFDEQTSVCSYFRATIKQISPEAEDALSTEQNEYLDFDYQYTFLKHLYDYLFGKDVIKSEVFFDYGYDWNKFENWKIKNGLEIDKNLWCEDLHPMVNKTKNVFFSLGKMQISVDFNWKNNNVIEEIQNILDLFPIADFSIVKDHNCKIPFEFHDDSLNNIEKILRDKFPSIQVEKDNIDGVLYFYQEYNGLDQKRRIETNLHRELESEQFKHFRVDLSHNNIQKEKYLFRIHQNEITETIEESLRELRGAEFKINDKNIGKLIRVKYPQIIIDFQDEEEISKLFEIGAITSITPNLTGDLEKISRLRDAFERISNNRRLQNKNLSEIIFDSSKAIPTENINAVLNESYDEIKEHLLNKCINDSQINAIIKSIFAKDIALIQGPPGTGKSTAIAEIIWQHIRKNSKQKILLTSETNLAVDNAIDRIVNNSHNLVKPIRFGDEEKLESEGLQFSLSAMKLWVDNAENKITTENDPSEKKLILVNWLENIGNRAKNTYKGQLWKNLLKTPPHWLREIVLKSYLKNVNVVGATCSSIGERNTHGGYTNFYKLYSEIYGTHQVVFDTVIQDESSKATPAELALPLIYGKKNIIIGDHRQLPPLLDKEEFLTTLDFLIHKTQEKSDIKKIKSLKSYVLKNFDELEISHFKRLFENIDESLKGVFNMQYRMHPDINEVIKQFYATDGGLDCGIAQGADDSNMLNPASRYHGVDIEGFIEPSNHVIWVDTPSPEIPDGTSYVNYGEIEAIKWILSKFKASESFKKYQSFWTNIEDQQIGLITFYGKQVKLLQEVKRDFEDIPIRISTVDRFQGMERNIVIVSTVRSSCRAENKDQKADYENFGPLGFPEQCSMGFAQSPNRLNVALSRAKRLLIIVGNSKLFRQKDIYDNVYHCIEKNPNGRIIKFQMQ